MHLLFILAIVVFIAMFVIAIHLGNRPASWIALILLTVAFLFFFATGCTRFKTPPVEYSQK